jgi:hypothetical protein
MMPVITAPTQKEPPWSVDIPVEQYEVFLVKADTSVDKVIRLTSSKAEAAGVTSIRLAFCSAGISDPDYNHGGDVTIFYLYDDFKDVYAVLESEKPCRISLYSTQNAGSSKSFGVDSCVVYTSKEPTGEGPADKSP